MEKKLMNEVLQIEGMTCVSCELKIEKALADINGIERVKAVYSSSNVFITFDRNMISLAEIIAVIEKIDYQVKTSRGNTMTGKNKHHGAAEDKMPANQLVGIGIIVVAAYVIVKNTVGFNFIPEIDQSMGYGILFVVGLMTSLHCIAMCGGINLSQCLSCKIEDKESGKLSKVKPSILYNAGRVISYTLIGGVVGALGSVISFSGAAKGMVAILSGILMVIMGLNLLNIFPWLRKFNPRMPKIFGNKIHSRTQHGPFYVGLLNGLMPCGPLQAMQLYALGTGSFWTGAASMFFFSLGTVPLMFGLGTISSVLSKKFTYKMMKASAVLVIVLGVVMVGRGLSLSGVAVASGTGTSGSVAEVAEDIQVVTTSMETGTYTPIAVQKGVPVKWIIQAEAQDLNGCNNRLLIPEYGIEKQLVPGENIIEFTPDKEGDTLYTCWMGMIKSNIKIVPDITKVTAEDVQSPGGARVPFGGSCCG